MFLSALVAATLFISVNAYSRVDQRQACKEMEQLSFASVHSVIAQNFPQHVPAQITILDDFSTCSSSPQRAFLVKLSDQLKIPHYFSITFLHTLMESQAIANNVFKLEGANLEFAQKLENGLFLRVYRIARNDLAAKLSVIPSSRKRSLDSITLSWTNSNLLVNYRQDRVLDVLITFSGQTNIGSPAEWETYVYTGRFSEDGQIFFVEPLFSIE